MFGTPLIRFSNHSEWKIRGNWSNAAYSGTFGYLNCGGQPGCLDGGNYPAVAPKRNQNNFARFWFFHREFTGLYC